MITSIANSSYIWKSVIGIGVAAAMFAGWKYVATPSREINANSLQGRVNIPQLDKEYWVRNHIFPKKLFKQFVTLAKTAYPIISLPQEFRQFLLFRINQQEVVFSSSYTLENTENFFAKSNIKDPFLHNVCQILLNQFAQELQLEGPHIISMHCVRYTPASGKNTSQNWHFDLGASYTMVMVLQNDFLCANEDDQGIDIGFNEVKGPFNPELLSKGSEASPQNGMYISLNYPHNGAIFFKGQQGQIIHRMSQLAAKTFSSDHPSTRTIVQIILKDKFWA